LSSVQRNQGTLAVPVHDRQEVARLPHEVIARPAQQDRPERCDKFADYDQKQRPAHDLDRPSCIPASPNTNPAHGFECRLALSSARDNPVYHSRSDALTFHTWGCLTSIHAHHWRTTPSHEPI